MVGWTADLRVDWRVALTGAKWVVAMVGSRVALKGP